MSALSPPYHDRSKWRLRLHSRSARSLAARFALPQLATDMLDFSSNASANTAMRPIFGWPIGGACCCRTLTTLDGFRHRKSAVYPELRARRSCGRCWATAWCLMKENPGCGSGGSFSRRFRGRVLRAMRRRWSNCTQRMLDEWRDGETRDIVPAMMLLDNGNCR